MDTAVVMEEGSIFSVLMILSVFLTSVVLTAPKKTSSSSSSLAFFRMLLVGSASSSVWVASAIAEPLCSPEMAALIVARYLNGPGR